MAKRVVFILVFIGCTGLNSMADSPELFDDPLRPPSYRYIAPAENQEFSPQVDTSGWILSAVLRSATRTIAVVNGKVMKVGDLLEGYRVTSIMADRVVLEKGKGKVILTRVGTGFKKDSTAEGNRK